MKNPIIWQLILDENDIAKFNYNNINAGELSHGIINSGFKCRYYGINYITISAILKINNFNLNQVICQLNNILKCLCRLNDLVNENYL